MRILVKIILLIVLVLALLVTGFAVGYPIGMNMGFDSGSEWAMLQAKLAAREAGVIMPVYYKDGRFHVVLRPSQDSRKIEEQQTVPAEDALPVENFVLADTNPSVASEPYALIPWLAAEDQTSSTACAETQNSTN